MGDQSRASTTTTGGDSSCSRTTTTPTTGTTRTATRIHRTTLLSTATGTVRRTAAMQPLRSVLAIESILPAQLYDRAFGGARVQREERLQVAIAAMLAGALAAPGLCSSARASAWELDPAATRIEFSVKNLLGGVRRRHVPARLWARGTGRRGSVALDDRGTQARSTRTRPSVTLTCAALTSSTSPATRPSLSGPRESSRSTAITGR